ncbi:MAG: dockerin type I repeat-containing protein [Clostridiales bacterium]|nr:dockerin type I repeat-containing protein [Clostridiales bacterium]
MKKIILLCFLPIAFALLGAQSVFAESSVTITSAIQTENGDIYAECQLTEPGENQEITLLAMEYNSEDLDTVIYLDQFAPTLDSENGFTVDFLPAEWMKSDCAYIIYVGGTGIEESDAVIIALYDGVPFKAGDVNRDGAVDEKDAALLLKYLSGTAEINGTQLAAGDADSNAVIDLTDAVAILNSEEQ